MADENKNLLGGEDSPKTDVAKTRVKKHKQLGVYKKCMIHLTQYAQQNTSIHLSINMYTVDVQPNTIVELPEGAIAFLKTATAAKHVFEPDATSENGNKGAHITKQVPKYIVELVD